ncbi:hypothetical protein LBMAG38_06540 [Chloroflexota bacterium]|nr:hypothetical protein LBMAG38_06540 [Chloroflexota bacterium]
MVPLTYLGKGIRTFARPDFRWWGFHDGPASFWGHPSKTPKGDAGQRRCLSTLSSKSKKVRYNCTGPTGHGWRKCVVIPQDASMRHVIDPPKQEGLVQWLAVALTFG